jgi:hypothetical protein
LLFHVQVFNLRTAHAIQTSSLWTLIAPSGNPSTDRHLRPSPMQCALTCEHVPLQHSPTPPSAGNSLFINLDSRRITPRFDYWMQVIKPSPGIDWMVHGRLSTSSSIWPEKGTRIVALLDRNCAALLYRRPQGGCLMIPRRTADHGATKRRSGRLDAVFLAKPLRARSGESLF